MAKEDNLKKFSSEYLLDESFGILYLQYQSARRISLSSVNSSYRTLLTLDKIKSKVLGSIAAKTVEKTQGNPNTLLKIIGKNFMSLPGFARDLNVARQNMQRLVKLEGGVPAKGADAHFLKEGDRATKLDVQVDKEEKKKATPAPKKGKSLISNLKDKFSASKILKSLTKYLVIGAVIGVIFIAFKDTFVEWAEGLWSAISEKFSEFTAGIKQWFADTIQPILDKVKELIQPLIDAVSNFIGKIGEWFKEKIGWFAETFPQTFAFIKKIIDKVSEVIDSNTTSSTAATSTSC